MIETFIIQPGATDRNKTRHQTARPNHHGRYLQAPREDCFPTFQENESVSPTAELRYRPAVVTSGVFVDDLSCSRAFPIFSELRSLQTEQRN